MASTISAGTTSGTAIAITGDTTGNLAFQTSAGTYTQTMPNVTGNIVTTGDTGTVTRTMISTSTSTGFGLCKSWIVSKNPAAGTISGSFNVSSFTRVSTGTYDVVFTTAMPNSNYAPIPGVQVSAWGQFVIAYIQTTTGYRLICADTGAVNADPTQIYCAVFSS